MVRGREAPLFGRRRVVLGLGALGFSGCGGGASLTAPSGGPPPVRNLIDADPGNYLARLAALRPGDTLRLAAGDYGVDALGRDTASVPGLPIFGLHGTAELPIVITGPETGPRPRLLGRDSHNTVRLADASHVVVRRLEIDGRGRFGFGVAAQGQTHDIAIEDNLFVGHGADQQVVAISTSRAPAWHWAIRRNVIVGAGTGLYLGNSDGANPFVAGLIEHNLIRDTIGYNAQIKHQVPWSGVPDALPSGPTLTLIRHNVFSKSSGAAAGVNARPNLLVGDQPASGPGALNGFAIYGNLFLDNPVESLFQGEGRIGFYGNLMVGQGAAVRIQPHNGRVRDVHLFHNTVVCETGAIVVTGGQTGTTQRLLANAVFSDGTPIAVSGVQVFSQEHLSGSRAAAATHLVDPLAAIGALDLYPRADGAARGSAVDLAGLEAWPDADRDFNHRPRDARYRGAYAGEGANPGWRPALEIKP